MKSRRYPPAYLRYFKARLWNLTRPSIWGTAIFLSVVGLVIKEYWANPAIFTSRQSKSVATQKEPNPTISPEDRATAADIDNLPVLAYDSKLALPPVDADEPSAKAKKQAKTPLEEALSKQTPASDTKLNVADNSVPTAKFNNPFLTQAENLLQLGNIQRSNRFVGLNALKPSSEQSEEGEFSSRFNIGLTRKNNSTDKAAINPLQAALNLSPTNQNLPNSVTGSSNSDLLQPSLNESLNSNQTGQNANSSLNSINNFRQLQPTNTLLQTGSQPYTSTTGLTPQGINVSPTIQASPGGSQFGVIPNSTGYVQPRTTNQPQIYNSNYNNGSLTQPQIYNGSYNNGNLNNNNLNSNQLPSNTTPAIPVTPVTLPVPNYTTPYSLNLNRTGAANAQINSQINNGALTNQGSQQPSQVQQYTPAAPNLLPTQYPSAGQGTRY
jgi:hypothetical protein